MVLYTKPSLHCIQMSSFGLDFRASTFLILAVKLALHKNCILLPLLSMLTVVGCAYIFSKSWCLNIPVLVVCINIQLEMLAEKMLLWILHMICMFGWLLIMGYLNACMEVCIVGLSVGLQLNIQYISTFHYPFCGALVWTLCSCNMCGLLFMLSITHPYLCSLVECL